MFISTASLGTRSENTGPDLPECKIGTSKACSVFLTAISLSGPFGELGLSYAQCTPLTHSTFYGVPIHGLASYLVQLEFSLSMRQEHWTGGVLRPGFEQI